MWSQFTTKLCILIFFSVTTIQAQVNNTDSLKTIALEEVVVNSSYKNSQLKKNSQPVEVIGREFIRENFTGNIVQSLNALPGVQSMDIGSGFSKPMIRGMGFNRISVLENGIKQEGQQWGADHGLEIDAFNAERIIIRKGPSSILYGSDAMGGAIELSMFPPPPDNQVFGEIILLGKSVNDNLGGSLMFGIKKNAWYTKFRYSEQHYGDYRVPTDSVVYLTQRLPVYGNKLKNTAGYERNISLYTDFRKNRYYSNYYISNAYQKAGFFPGAHGIPDASRLEDDGNSRNIDLPYSTVNHFKASTHQHYIWDKCIVSLDLGYQNNHREELSLFHTHYGNQPIPDKDPDKELAFTLNTFSSSAKAKILLSPQWEHVAGWDNQYQHNSISGYSFLLPRFERFTTGLFWLSTWQLNNSISLSGGIRYDYGKIDTSPYKDEYLKTYLQDRGYDNATIEKYEWRSYAVKRDFSDLSGSVGLVWTPRAEHIIKVNLGRSFRLPGANELASNGVHHGTFRHEQGDPTLSSEKGWQIDMSYIFEHKGIMVSISPFASWFENYIYLKPTGEWSILPHSGQINKYTGAEVIFAGTEVAFGIDFLQRFNYSFSGEYVYTYNRDENIPLAFSAPASMRNTLKWQKDKHQIHIELQSIATQNRVARNEATTSGANLLHAGAQTDISIGNFKLELSLLLQNILNKEYYNHLSFYRRVEIPESGRNIQLLIKIPFKNRIK